LFGPRIHKTSSYFVRLDRSCAFRGLAEKTVLIISKTSKLHLFSNIFHFHQTVAGGKGTLKLTIADIAERSNGM